MSGSLGPLGVRELSKLSHRLDAGPISPHEEKRLIHMLDKIFSPGITLNEQEHALATELLHKIGQLPGTGHYELFLKYCGHQPKTPSTYLKENSLSMLQEWAISTHDPYIERSVQTYISQKRDNPKSNPLLALNVETNIILPSFLFTDPSFGTLKLRISSNVHLPPDLTLEQIQNSALYAQIEAPMSYSTSGLSIPKKAPKIPEVTHDDIIKLLEVMGFMSNDEGICAGIAQTGCRYLVLEKIDAFDEQIINIGKLLEFLFEDDLELDSLTNEKLQETCAYFSPNFYTNLRNFLGKIDLSFHENSVDYKEFLKYRTPFDEEMQRVECAYNVFTPNSFLQTLTTIKTLMLENFCKDTLAISISNIAHEISIGYNPQKDLWYFINASKIQTRRVANEQTLAQEVFNAFRLYPDTLSLIFYTSKKPYSPNLVPLLQNLLHTDKNLTLSLDQAQRIPADKLGILLASACEKNSLDAVSMLLEAGADPNWLNPDEQTPLCIACTQCHLDVAKLLIAKGANINHLSHNGLTPLQIACLQEDLDMMDLLIRNHADINIKAFHGVTALYSACENGSLSAVAFLLSKGARPNIANDFSVSPILIASYLGHTEVIEQLISHGAIVNYVSRDGSFPLGAASLRGNVDTVNLLLASGAMPNQVDQEGNTALLLACSQNHLEIASLLAQEPISINLQNMQGFTPLHIACYKGSLEIAKVLLENGANPDLRTESGHTPLDIADSKGYTAIAEEIKKRQRPKRKHR